MNTQYEVGYCKPPEHTRWKPGQSGNPRGRPKGAKNKSRAARERPLRDAYGLTGFCISLFGGSICRDRQS